MHQIYTMYKYSRREGGALRGWDSPQTLSSEKCPFPCSLAWRRETAAEVTMSGRARPPQSPDRPPDVSTIQDAAIQGQRSGLGG